MYKVERLDAMGSVYETYGGFKTPYEATKWAQGFAFPYASYQISGDDQPETNQFDPEMVEALDGILCDINPAEIAGQIERDHLSQWCETIRAEILKKVKEANE